MTEYVNRFRITVNGDGIARICFKEVVDGTEFERVTAAMTVADALSLADAIRDTVERAKVKVATGEKKP